jgi:membrane fusion protein, multidrug efflux system
MASKLFRPSRLIAVALVIGAVLWIAAGQFGGEAVESDHVEGVDAEPAIASVPLQKVSVTTVTPELHRRTVVLSCVTEADRRASAVARGAGVIVDLTVSRGTRVRAGDVIAMLSDEGRGSAVAQAQALLDQRLAEYDANKQLIDRGDAPRNTLPALEAAVAAARAALAAADAEADRSIVRAPIDGIVDTVAFQIGQAMQAGSEIAVIVDPDPMLAVGQISEARRTSVKAGQPAEIRFIDGTRVLGTVNFVGLSADTATRTYPVEATMANPHATIADGVTCELVVTLEPLEAAAVPRSALVFSDAGHLGVRVADSDGRAQFLPIDIVEDARELVWVTGIDKPTQVIVVGQDFVKDGDLIEAISSAEAAVAAEPPA